MKLGDEDQINQHVSHRYKLIQFQVEQSKKKLEHMCELVKLKNPSLIHQIKQAALVTQPYQLRMAT